MANDISLVTTIVAVLLSVASLAISMIALRFTHEQARSYLFPVPTIYMDPQRQAVVLRNFGYGAMLSVSSEVKITEPGQAQITLARYHPSLAQGETAVLLPPEIVSSTAILKIDATIAYENIKRERTSAKFLLTSDQLSVAEL